jgi:hypothetical protein
MLPKLAKRSGRRMSRRTHLTILEAGAALSLWPRAETSSIDDWVVMVQQRDESPDDFVLRVTSRTRRLTREGAGICAVEILSAGGARADWRSVLEEVAQDFPQGRARDRAEPRSGIHEKPGPVRTKPARLGRAAGEPA